jgi:hypothetical protein
MQRWPSRRALSGPWIETFSSKRPLPEDDVPGETDGQNSEIPTDRGFSLADVKHLLEYQTKQLLEQTKQTHRQTAEVSSAALNNMISPQGATFLHSTGQNQIRITYDIFLVMWEASARLQSRPGFLCRVGTGHCFPTPHQHRVQQKMPPAPSLSLHFQALTRSPERELVRPALRMNLDLHQKILTPSLVCESPNCS